MLFSCTKADMTLFEIKEVNFKDYIENTVTPGTDISVEFTHKGEPVSLELYLMDNGSVLKTQKYVVNYNSLINLRYCGTMTKNRYLVAIWTDSKGRRVYDYE